MPELIFAVLLVVAGLCVVVGVGLFDWRAALIACGPVIAGWGWLVFGDVE